jgi:hypothetical protein
VKTSANSATSATIDFDSSIDDGKLPLCSNCKKPIFDPNQLCNLDGFLYCKNCRDKILAQRKNNRN